MSDHEPEAVIADKGDDRDALVEVIEARGAEAVIPPKSNRTKPPECDRPTDKERNVRERFGSKAKP